MNLSHENRLFAPLVRRVYVSHAQQLIGQALDSPEASTEFVALGLDGVHDSSVKR